MNSPVIIVRVIQKVIIHNGEEEHTLHNTVTVSSTWAAASYSQSPCSRSLRCYTTNSIPFPFFGSPPRPRPTLFHSLSPSTASPYTNVFFQGRILLETAQCRITFWQTRIKHFSLSFVSCATAVRWVPTVRDLRRLMAGGLPVCRVWMRRRWRCLPLPSSEHSTRSWTCLLLRIRSLIKRSFYPNITHFQTILYYGGTRLFHLGVSISYLRKWGDVQPVVPNIICEVGWHFRLSLTTRPSLYLLTSFRGIWNI